MASYLFKRNEITKVAKEILATKANIIALVGPLGAGKTALTKEIAKQLGITDEITSPTFVLHTEYRVSNTKSYLHHIDCWRMESFSELENIGFYKMLSPENIVVLEWADKFKSQIANLKFQKIIWITLDYVKNKNERSITYENFGD